MGSSGAGLRELGVAVGAILLASRLIDPPAAWVVAGLLLVAVALAGLQILGEAVAGPGAAAGHPGVPVEALVLPATAAVAAFGATRLVPLGVLLVPAAVLGAWFTVRLVALEARILGAASGPSAADRTAILALALVIAFLGFVGIAGLVPGGLPDAGDTAAPTGAQLAILAAADALIAALLGYRFAALRAPNLRDAAWFAFTAGSVVAIAAAALRTMEIPRLLGPALLVLVLFLWDAVHAAPTRRRDGRRLWETILLAALGLAIVAWSLRLRS